MRTFLALGILALTAWAANLKLYLKDGSFHLVSEYQVQADRVRFYSVERSEWEEMPLDLVDLNRTRSEEAARKEEVAKEAKALSDEDRVERELQQEILRIPENPGVYWLEGNEAKSIKAAESSVHTNKGRSVLKVLAPMPVVSGKATVEIDQAHSLNIFTNPEQEFYIQLSDPERFGIMKLKPKVGIRIVENLTIVPVTKEVIEEAEMVEIFQKQLTSGGLYKIWPKEPLEAGEYAVVEYTAGKLNMQIWDFAVKPGKK
jgi:hypothetical protein